MKTFKLTDVLMSLIGMRDFSRGTSGLITFDHNSRGYTSVNTCAPSITFANIDQLTRKEVMEDHLLALVQGTGGTFGMA